jgi:hypothetical protein
VLNITILDAPTDLGLAPTGVDGLGTALRAAGLRERLDAAYAGDQDVHGPTPREASYDRPGDIVRSAHERCVGHAEESVRRGCGKPVLQRAAARTRVTSSPDWSADMAVLADVGEVPTGRRRRGRC